MNSELFARVIPQNIENCSANEIHRWCEKCFWWSNKSLFLAWQGAASCNDKDSLYADVNDNDEREFVDNYMEIRVPQKVKESYPRMEEAQNLLKCILPFSPATVRQCVIT